VRALYGQHEDWLSLGFLRALASNSAVCRCLIDKRWLYTLLAMIVGPAADDDEERDVARGTQHTTSLPKRVRLPLLLPASEFSSKTNTPCLKNCAFMNSAKTWSNFNRFAEFFSLRMRFPANLCVYSYVKIIDIDVKYVLYLSCVNYSMLLLSDFVVIVVCPLFMSKIKNSDVRHLHDKNV